MMIAKKGFQKLLAKPVNNARSAIGAGTASAAPAPMTRGVAMMRGMAPQAAAMNAFQPATRPAMPMTGRLMPRM